SVNWDPSVLAFRSLKNLNSGVPGLNSSVFNTSPEYVNAGQIGLAWIESGVNPITIPDGSIFFTIEFEVIGSPCDNSPVAITGTPVEIVVANGDEVEVGLVADNGVISVPGVGCSES